MALLPALIRFAEKPSFMFRHYMLRLTKQFLHDSTEIEITSFAFWYYLLKYIAIFIF